MPISSIRNRRPSKSPLYASSSNATLHYTTNTAIVPLSPTVASRGKPFTNIDGSPYYEYFVHPSGAPLPTGITLNLKTGEISGTPTSTTVLSETLFSTTSYIAARDSRGYVAFKKSAITFIITDPFVATISGPLYLNGVIGQANFDLPLFTSITGGRPPYVFSIINGALPTGMSINQTSGRVSGAPTDVKRTYTDVSQTTTLPITPRVVISVRDFYNTISSVTSTLHFNLEENVQGVANAKITITGPLPLTVYYNSFSSVSLGVPPYTYFIPPNQSGSYPTGVTLNAATGVISGTYSGVSSQVVNGVTVVTRTPYQGTLKVGVRDSTGNIASTVAEVEINAYVPFEVKLSATNIDQVTKLATKSFSFKPFIGSNGVKPYVFRIINYIYTDTSNTISTQTVLPAKASLLSSDGTFRVSSGGIPAGVYRLQFGAHDATGYEAPNIPEIVLTIRETVVGIPLISYNLYELYVNESSEFDTFTDVMTAELGVPPYNYSLNKRLPVGMTSATVPDISTGFTKYQIKGPITGAGRTNIIVSVADSVGSIAPEKAMLDFNIKKHISSVETVINIEAFVGDEILPIKVFSSITDGFMPYRLLKNTGTLRPELEVITSNYNSDLPDGPTNGYTYYDAVKNTTVTEKDIKIWGTNWTDDPVNGKTLVSNKTWLYSGTNTMTYLVQDAKGELGANMSTININIHDRLTWTSSYYLVTGVANVTEVNFSPITVSNGLPPYSIKAVTSRFNPLTGLTEMFPNIGLKVTDPNLITGIPTRPFTGTLYYYMIDSAKGRTDDVAVEFNIVSPILATAPLQTTEIMCVVGTEKYELKTSTVAPTVTTLNYNMFTNVQYGIPPYTFSECDSAGNAIASKLPRNFSIDSATGILTGFAQNSLPLARTDIFCTVQDTIGMKGARSKVSIVVYDRMTTTLVDNTATVTNVDGTKSPTTLSWWTGAGMYGYIMMQAANGSGRYVYSVSSTDLNVFNQYLKINSSTGMINLSNAPSGSRYQVTDVFDITFKVTVVDSFTGVSVESSQAFTFKTVAEFKVSTLMSSVTLTVGESAAGYKPINIVGGSGQYTISSVTPSLPNGVSINANGYLAGSPTSIMPTQYITVEVRDTVYNKLATTAFSVKTNNKTANINISNATNRTVTMDNISTATNLSSALLASTPVAVNINVTGTVTSTSSSSAALTVTLPTLAPASTIEINVTGSIIGSGGAGGTPSTTASSRNGKDGGTGLRISAGSTPVTIKSSGSGTIGGGGGGGGAGGQMWMGYNVFKLYRYLAHQTVPTEWTVYDGRPYSTFIWANTIYEYVYDSTYKELSNSYMGTIYIPDPHPYPTPFVLYYSYSASMPTFFESRSSSERQVASTTVNTVSGAKGGAGAGISSSLLNGLPGENSIEGTTYTGNISTGVPSEQDFIDAGYSPGLAVASISSASTLEFGYKSGTATSGGGTNGGESGVDVPTTDVTLWGCAGGGGGGLGGAGGDGDTCIDVPPNGAIIYPGGTGGRAGAAINSTGTYVTISIESGVNIVGEII